MSSHRTAPHGAGCANVIVCPRNSVFLELRVDSDVQWSMRRTASVVPLRDGCVIGREVAPWRDRPGRAGCRRRLSRRAGSPPLPTAR